MRTLRPEPDGAPVILRVDGLTVKRPRFTLWPINFSAVAGERIALVGPNGAGKSTTMTALAGLLPTYRGNIFLGGEELRSILPEARARLGLLPEKVPAYDEVTVAGHFAFLGAFQPRWNAALASELLGRLRVDPGQKMGKLSKGNRVKVGYIAAEAIEPKLLLLDEPTSGLDPVIRGELLEILDERLHASPDRVLIFSTHILEDIDRIAQRVLLINEGRLVADLPVSALADGSRSIAQSLYERIRANA